MILSFKPFEDFIKHNTTLTTQSRYYDSQVISIDIRENTIKAVVWGTGMYQVNIDYDNDRVHKVKCSCLYNHEGVCKHIVRVLVSADKELNKTEGFSLNLPKNKKIEDASIIEENSTPSKLKIEKINDTYYIKDQTLISIPKEEIVKYSDYTTSYGWWYTVNELSDNYIEVSIHGNNYYRDFKISIKQTDGDIMASCSCKTKNKKLCEHITYGLLQISKSNQFLIAFDEQIRLKKYREQAAAYGIADMEDTSLEQLFSFKIEHGRASIEPSSNFIKLDNDRISNLRTQLLPSFSFPKHQANNKTKKEFIVIVEDSSENKYDFRLMTAPLAKNGNIKSPINEVNIYKKIRTINDQEKIRFYLSFINEFGYDDDYDDDIRLSYEQIDEIFKNSENLEVYIFHNNLWDDRITPQKLVPVFLEKITPQLEIEIRTEQDFYIVNCKVTYLGRKFNLKKIILQSYYFLYRDTFYFIPNQQIIQLISFFKEYDNNLTIHRLQFPTFKKEILEPLEKSITIQYDNEKKAPTSIVKKQKLDRINKYLIYLSSEDNWVTITPVVAYRDIEIAVISKKSIRYTDENGEILLVQRNNKSEDEFLKKIQALHPNFKELPATDFFYLSKEEFLEDAWFLDAFETWQKENYVIMGFKEINLDNLNTNKAKITSYIKSGIDWFDIETDISFGNQQVSLRDVQKAVLNKSRYVKLGDGTKGLLPQEWIEKFKKYFRSGEIKDNHIRTHKSNFSLIDTLFEKEELDNEVLVELTQYKEKFNNFSSIDKVKVPKKLKAQLRDYQKDGLNWLNFLEEFKFGGILADDMGLGKTIQIIAYILYQQEQKIKGTNLVIVPTSLLFNWQREIEKFAPHLKFLVLYGTNRNTKKVAFNKYDITLTTYGTLLSDIEILKKHAFNLIVLDESQAIKNPSSQRYKAVRLLQGRQKIAATGTPVENNTFDLYAQLSFVMPGLLGSQKKFMDDYATPIDKFQDEEMAKELQQKVHPFILRRTKKQVAKELPDKTEMVITCEMGKQQRKVYEAYKAEFQNYLLGASDEELQKSSLHVLQGLTKLRQICNSPALLSDQEYYGSESSKLDELMHQVNKLKGEHKILIFSQFVGMLELIKERLEQEKINYAYLTGKTRNREQQVELFQNDDTVRIFLISLKAGGTGLNLTQAEYVFIVDPWWNPAVENQAIDRAYRIGQNNHVIAIRLIVPDSIEDKILQLQKRKLKLVEDLIHTDKNAFKNLSKDDLLSLV